MAQRLELHIKGRVFTFWRVEFFYERHFLNLRFPFSQMPITIESLYEKNLSRVLL